MPLKPSEKRTRVSSSEEEISAHVLVDDAILKDIQKKLEKPDMLKINSQLSTIKHDITNIKSNVTELEKGLNAVPDEDTKSCWIYLLLISCLMSTLLSLGHAISVMRQFLFCWSTHANISRRLWPNFLSVYIQKSERNLQFSLSLTSQYYYYRYHYYCCCWWCFYKQG